MARLRLNPNRRTSRRIAALVQVLLLLLGTAAVGRAALVPTLEEEDAAWAATHVVVVDGAGMVEERWKGDAVRGEVIDLQSLGARRHALIANPFPGSVPQDRQNSTEGERLILFLEDTDPTKRRRWQAATTAFGSLIHCAMAWDERGVIYAYKTSYVISVMCVTPTGDAGAFYNRIQRTLKLQRSFNIALREPSPERRAWKIAPFAVHKCYIARATSLRTLTELRHASLPVFRHLLLKTPYSSWTADHINAAANAGRREAVPLLVDLATRELKYWRSRIPNLRKDGSARDESSKRHRYVLQVTLDRLADLRDPRAKQVARRLLSLWRATPKLDDRTDTDGIDAACQHILNGERSRFPALR